MPLHKRKPFSLADAPHDLDPNELVYQVRFTKEIFRDYQEYLNRLNMYRQRLWTCKVTGKINLTYEEALVSENNATERVQQFPTELVPHVLNIIQNSTLNLKDLVSKIHMDLQKNLYKGLELHAKKGDSVCVCKIIEIMKDREIIRYKVGWIDKEKKVTDMSVVSAEDLILKKAPFSRNILKAFIRESTCRASPWFVNEKLAKKHGILTSQIGAFDISKDSKKGGRKNKLDNQNFRPNQKRKTENRLVPESLVEEPIKYPIDDLLVKPSSDDPVFTERPPPCTDFLVPIDCVGDLLMVWNFFIYFARLLHLWPFSLEDFEHAICHKDSELMLIVESHSTILKFLIMDGGDYFMAIQSKKRKLKIKFTNWAKYLCHFLEMSDKSELSNHVAIIKRGHYGLLDIHVKLSILRELVAEVLKTSAIRDRLDECIEQNKVLVARKREEAKTKKEEYLLNNDEDHTKQVDQQLFVNGERKYANSTNGSIIKYQNGDVKASGKEFIKNIKENSMQRKIIKLPERRESKNGDNQDKISIVQQNGGHITRELEKPSIRTNCIGKDKDYNRYWFFRREGRLFVESFDSNGWGYYSTKEELDALMDSLNEKGERERDLKRNLEKNYAKISTALQKRSKDIAQKGLVEEGEVRRSMRVRSQPRCSTSMTFHRYVNKWKASTNLQTR